METAAEPAAAASAVREAEAEAAAEVRELLEGDEGDSLATRGVEPELAPREEEDLWQAGEEEELLLLAAAVVWVATAVWELVMVVVEAVLVFDAVAVLLTTALDVEVDASEEEEDEDEDEAEAEKPNASLIALYTPSVYPCVSNTITPASPFSFANSYFVLASAQRREEGRERGRTDLIFTLSESSYEINTLDSELKRNGVDEHSSQ